MTLAEVLEYGRKINSQTPYGLTHDLEIQAEILHMQTLKRLVRCSLKNVRHPPLHDEQDKTTVRTQIISLSISYKVLDFFVLPQTSWMITLEMDILCSLVIAFAVILNGGKLHIWKFSLHKL